MSEVIEVEVMILVLIARLITTKTVQLLKNLFVKCGLKSHHLENIQYSEQLFSSAGYFIISFAIDCQH